MLKDYDWITIQRLHNSGKTWRDLTLEFGITHSSLSKANKLGYFTSKTISQAAKGSNRDRTKVSEEHRQLMSNHAIRRGLGGTRNSNKFDYVTISGITIKLDSSYEVKVATELDENQIIWERPKPLTWISNDEKCHRYYPDFYLPAYDVYLDPKHKGIIPLHEEKIRKVVEQNNIRLYVLTVEQLTWAAIRKQMGS